ncbi:TetR/AcrR family transcriptional regulator [Nocardia sp. NPDC087230]|uniref:TetR/AcrR family transcriptional regulator n=1 Tax=Nocardia sp. NPDC087230 TaxID=3364331 RepID=UPI00380DBD6A
MPPKATRRRKQPSQPRRQPSQDRAKETRDHILDTAAELFGSHGVAQTSTNRIAAEAGVSIGTLYRYFAAARSSSTSCSIACWPISNTASPPGLSNSRARQARPRPSTARAWPVRSSGSSATSSSRIPRCCAP